MHPFVGDKQPAYRAVLGHLQKELGSLRTGRASPAMVEDVKVMAYDSTMDLKGVASITAQDAKTLIIEPWDKSLIQAIEKAVRDADMGVNPAVDGERVRISLPPMTEENRKQLVKLMKERLETARVSLRQVREAAREEVMRMGKEGGVSEDEKFKILDELDKATKDAVAEADAMAERKEEEIMTV
ncbi:ribosome recycling factor [Candidatus Uhrbacteria bacterium RIFCSPHIGHO2_01_FULL_63_20]|uniref:Ribosome-recycling factor n=1 Tax=Candidatus Uhrbacteria bacterium RIFCSPHIGHO2_01_FULL_63_20 TaxID=1802385 RepID=A0A1F7TMD6_9BACT|nr:MAG: ribosome recycling factor [Candidatus Uhrbacteria bacterium RIFCSPHIGHO2_01_FULL_63_20]